MKPAFRVVPIDGHIAYEATFSQPLLDFALAPENWGNQLYQAVSGSCEVKLSDVNITRSTAVDEVELSIWVADGRGLFEFNAVGYTASLYNARYQREIGYFMALTSSIDQSLMTVYPEDIIRDYRFKYSIEYRPQHGIEETKKFLDGVVRSSESIDQFGIGATAAKAPYYRREFLNDQEGWVTVIEFRESPVKAGNLLHSIDVLYSNRGQYETFDRMSRKTNQIHLTVLKSCGIEVIP